MATTFLELSPPPSGNIEIYDTNVTNVAAYSTAQVVDNNLTSANIITGKTILGIVGSAAVPSGNINITTTNVTDVASYATAQVVDSNLAAENIITGKTILGIAGSAAVPSGDITITTNTTTDVSSYANAITNIPEHIPEEIDTDAGMTAVLIAANVGKAYKFTGTTGTYTNGDVYVVEET